MANPAQKKQKTENSELKDAILASKKIILNSRFF